MLRATAQKMAHLILRLWMTAFNRLRAPRLRLDRPTVIVANHASHLDIAAIFAALPMAEIPNVRTAAAKDHVFAFPRPVVRLLEFLFNIFPFERTGGSSRSLTCCADYVARGRHVVMFPEARRSPDGRFLGLTPGFASVAYKSGATVVPLRLDGTHRALPRKSSVPVSYPVRVTAGPGFVAERVPHDERLVEYRRMISRAERTLGQSHASS